MKIAKILRFENKGEWARVFVQLEDGSEAQVFIGGQVETWFDHAHNKAKAFVKKIDKTNKLA